MKKLIIFTFFVFFSFKITAFPGDHNSLTCTKYLFAEFDSNGEPILDSTGFPKINSELQRLYYCGLPQIDPEKRDGIIDWNANACREMRQTALNTINENMQNIQKIIKQSHDMSLDITIWGDSLSDLIDFYGAVPFDWFGAPHIPIADYGNEPGYIDSFGDYFTIFGNFYPDHFTIKNYSQSGDKTENLLGKVDITLDEKRDVLQTGSHCIPKSGSIGIGRTEEFNGKSAMRSMVMIGGNDIIGMVHGNWLPFLNRYAVDMTLDNISIFIDWNIENGKQVFLLGTIPPYSEPIQPYNNILINRKTLCGPVEDLLIEPAEVPWWVCAFSPGICTSIVKKVIDYNEQILRDIKIFYHHLNSPSQYGVEGQVNRINTFLSIAGINQACINDRIQSDFGPIYKTAYPQNVDFLTLYNYFSNAGSNGFAANYWNPIPSTYTKMDGKLVEPIHIGPYGYKLWAQVVVPKLIALGWNKTPTYEEIPHPIINLNNDGPGKKIRQKALESSLQGKETTGITERIKSVAEDNEKGSGMYGGYFREYKINSAVIYLKQIKGNEPVPSGDSRYGEPYLLSGTISGKYKELGGPAGSLGFPTSDVYLIHYGTIYRVDFECGAIENNTLDFLNSTYVYYHNPKPEGCK